MSEDIYLSWESDERPMPSRHFTRMLLLLRKGGRIREYVERVFLPLAEAVGAAQEKSDLTRSAPTGDTL